MPKVELHVHLEGSIQPEVLLQLASRNGVELPADSVEGLRDWYTFTDFSHFVEVYIAISSCVCSGDDIEFVAREFLRDQAAQNILYTEAIFTPYTHYSLNRHIPFEEQMAALASARSWAADQLGIGVNWVLDFARNVEPAEHSVTVAQWAISAMDRGVVGLGVGGLEKGYPPELFARAFDMAREAGLASLPHAGEIAGAESVRGAVETLGAARIGHGVRCLEDQALVEMLVEQEIPLDVSPTSNVCLGVARDFASHPLPKLIDVGLLVTLNSDDPPMFNTSLTDEYLRCVGSFGWGPEELSLLVMNAANAVLLDAEEKASLVGTVQKGLKDVDPG